MFRQILFREKLEKMGFGAGPSLAVAPPGTRAAEGAEAVLEAVWTSLRAAPRTMRSEEAEAAEEAGAVQELVGSPVPPGAPVLRS